VSEKGFTRNGTAVIVEEQKAKGSDMEHWTGKSEAKQDEAKKIDDFVVTDDMRLEGYNNKTTTDDHGMHIYGIAKDQNGELYYMVKNSWGESGKYKGIWYASEDFVSYKTLNIVVHKDALPKHIAKKLGIK
jgi:aminopeptidase C